ncbi:MAG: hypothetical protein KIS81_09880 [Maricaulaceae bacterium]|nr:hypothetical protein [Maricaulaceae bacterium]
MSETADLDRAYAALGLAPGAGLRAARAAFRRIARAVHPDVAAATPENLSRLAAALAAIRAVERAEPAVVEVMLDAAEAARGAARTVLARGRALILRIPAGAAEGALLPFIGEPGLMARVRIRPETPQQAPGPGGEAGAGPVLADFIRRFAAPSPAARFARWTRRRPAA